MYIKRHPHRANEWGANKYNKHAYFTEKASSRKYKRKFNRALLQSPAAYYSKQFPGITIKSEWVTVLCCFHEEKTPSLSVNMVKGNFRCHACGAKGHDIIAFHQLRYKTNFIDVVTYFGAWSHE